MKYTFFLLLSTVVYADNYKLESEKQYPKVADSYFYGSLNLGPFPLPAPGFGLGYRLQNNHWGFDTHVQMTTLLFVDAYKLQSTAMYYFKPNLKSEFYAGFGGSIGRYYGEYTKLNLASPEFIFGKSYLNKDDNRRYVELQVSFPTFISKDENRRVYIPLCVFSYGIGF